MEKTILGFLPGAESRYLAPERQQPYSYATGRVYTLHKVSETLLFENLLNFCHTLQYFN